MIILKTLKLLLLIIPQISGIIFDQGLCYETCWQENANYPNFNCKSQSQFTIAFNYPFDNIPQVFLVLDHLGVSVKTDFRMSIQDVTKLNFRLNAVCLTGWANCVIIKWYAIDDQRFQIIDAFNTTGFTQQKFQHKNKNVNTEIGLITMISHNFDEINFNLTIDEITSDDVTVSLVKEPADFPKLVQVGFQIILGPKEAFQNFFRRQNAWFITPFTGMGYPYTDAVRLDKQTWWQGGSTYYSLKTWQTVFTPCHHSHGLLILSITAKFYSLNLINLQVLQKSQLISATQISIYFLNNNQVLDTIGEHYVSLDKDLTNVIIEITIVCPQGKTIESNFEKCFDCSIQKLYKSNYQCSNTLKELVFKNQYKKQTPAYSEFVIKIQENLYEMKQLLYNQNIEEAVIFSITLKDI